MDLIDNLLNKITMYRLVLYYLCVLVAAAIVFGALGILPYSPLAIIGSLLILTAACWIVNTVCAKLFRVPTNFESVYITALILTLIISPITFNPFDTTGFWFLIWASIFAMVSKYLIAINRKHICNPAAIAVAATAILFSQYASWWVGGNLPLLAFVVAGGLLLVRKLRRFDLVIAFSVAALASIVLTNLDFNPITTIEKALIHTSIFFFGFVMLTEPLTTPPTRPLRIAYGLLVGALFSPVIHIGSLYATPELALVAGNLFSFAVSPSRNYKLTLTAKQKIADNLYDFAFSTGGKSLNFKPGQYMEFTIDGKGADSRGNRRYFTIASSPTEKELHLGVKFHDDAEGNGSSSFKKKMLALQPGDSLVAGSLAGDFTLPQPTSGREHKFVFIAGGIGVTPFRSMVKYLSDRKQPADIVLLYSNRTASEVAYRSIFEDAQKTIGLTTNYIATDTDGRIDVARIQREIPDWKERIFYISGTHGMIVAFKKTLRDVGVPRTHIKTDFFPGFA